MAKITSTGQCRLCGAAFSKSAISRHLASCAKTKTSAPAAKSVKRKFPPVLMHVAIQDFYAPDYWLHLAIPPKAKLQALDNMLRDIWLECCGHLSSFNIGGVRYDSVNEFGMESGMESESMNTPIGKVLNAGDGFNYEYDFGSTTALVGRVLSDLPNLFGDSKIHLLARNDPPAIVCETCGQPATQVCAECYYNEGGWLCAKCAKKHECGEEMLLPVLNSPRTGICAYCGPSREP